MVVVAKFAYYPNGSVFEIVLDCFILIETLVKNFSNRKVGYEPPKQVEEVDDSHSITVGYAEDHGKQLFWERNSVEGI